MDAKKSEREKQDGQRNRSLATGVRRQARSSKMGDSFIYLKITIAHLGTWVRFLRPKKDVRIWLSYFIREYFY